jgi:hypothetical protein
MTNINYLQLTLDSVDSNTYKWYYQVMGKELTLFIYGESL